MIGRLNNNNKSCLAGIKLGIAVMKIVMPELLLVTRSMHNGLDLDL